MYFRRPEKWLLEMAASLDVSSVAGLLNLKKPALVRPIFLAFAACSSARHRPMTTDRVRAAGFSPFSKITIPEYIENRIKENTPASLDEAERLAVGNAGLLKRIANARAQHETPAAPARP